MTRIAVKARRMGRLMNVGAMITVAGTGVIGGNGGLGWEGEQMLDASGGPLDMSNLVAGVAGVKLSLMSKMEGGKILNDQPRGNLKKLLKTENNHVHSGDKVTVTMKVEKTPANIQLLQWEGHFAGLDVDHGSDILLLDQAGLNSPNRIPVDDIQFIQVAPQGAAPPAQSSARPGQPGERLNLVNVKDLRKALATVGLAHDVDV